MGQFNGFWEKGFILKECFTCRYFCVVCAIYINIDLTHTFNPDPWMIKTSLPPTLGICFIKLNDLASIYIKSTSYSNKN